MQKLTKIWILWLVFISAPGSGLLLSDGIPFTSKLEFAVVSLSLLAISSRAIREQLKRLMTIPNHLFELIPVFLMCLIFVKVLTFAALPLGNGFESCYRSIYTPDENVTCEKSFDFLFSNEDDINGTGSLTRVEPNIDFRSLNWDGKSGASNSTWKLPFANDYPRLSAPWLDRIPFTAQFGTKFSSKPGRLLPIAFTGEIKVNLNGEDLGQYTSYVSRNTIFLPLSTNDSVLKVDYRFSDDNNIAIPDVAPAIKGPWAHLQIFEPIKPADISAITGLTISGWTFDPSIQQTPKRIEIQNSDGIVVAQSDLSARPDVSAAFSNPLLLQSGFYFEISNEVLINTKGPLQVFAVHESQSVQIAEVTYYDLQSILTPTVEVQNSENSQSDVSVERRVFENSIGLLEGQAQTQPDALFKLLNLLVNFLYLFISIFLAFATVVAVYRSKLTHAKSLLFGMPLLVLTYLADLPFSTLSFIVIFVFALLFISTWKRLRLNFLVLILPLAFSIERVIQKILKLIGLGNVDWWNFSLWRSRDSDWFVAQGYARQILNDFSLRGGEGVFYFQPGIRYFLFIQHAIFGDNDIVFAFGWIAALVFGVFKIFSILANSQSGVKLGFLFSLALASLLQAIFNPTIAEFAIHQASEFPTWILLVAFFAMIMRKDLTANQIYLASFLVALSSQLRPNQAIGSIVLLLLLLMTVRDLAVANRLTISLRTLAIWGITSSLSLLHNLHYAKTMQIFSSTGELNADFKFHELLRTIFSADARSLVFPKIEYALSWTDISLLNFRTFLIMQLVWLCALSIVIFKRERRIRIWTALILPFAYLIPLLPYRFDSYYPRHIVIIQLAFVFSGLYAMHQCINTSSNTKKV